MEAENTRFLWCGKNYDHKKFYGTGPRRRGDTRHCQCDTKIWKYKTSISNHFWIETAFLAKNVKKRKNVAKNDTSFRPLQKVAQLLKNRPLWSPWPQIFLWRLSPGCPCSWPRSSRREWWWGGEGRWRCETDNTTRGRTRYAGTPARCTPAQEPPETKNQQDFEMAVTLGRVTRRLENKFAQILEKVAETVVKSEIVKISTSKLNLKVQNIYIK